MIAAINFVNSNAGKESSTVFTINVSAMKYACVAIIFCIGLAACHYAKPQNDAGKNTVIQIQPLGDISEDDQQYVYNEIKKIYPYITLAKPLAMPRTAFNTKRNRYRADSLLTFLCAYAQDGEVVLGITNKDISTTKNKVKDQGILGLGFCPGKACIASSFRLSKKNRQEQLFKVCIHELGHTQGLKHCPVTDCYMHDEDGRNTTDEETGFCAACTSVLLAKGWKIGSVKM